MISNVKNKWKTYDKFLDCLRSFVMEKNNYPDKNN